jgi:hypothetical protein
LENRVLVLAPPFFTDSGVVFTELEKVAKDWGSTRDFGKPFDVRDIGSKSGL